MPMYAALIYTPDLDWTAPEQAETVSAAVQPSSARSGGEHIRGGAALFPTSTATTVRVKGGRGGEVVTSDGPYAETKEVLGGLLPARVRRPRRGDQRRGRDPGAPGTAPSRCGPSSRCEPAARRGGRLAEVVRVEGGRILAVLARTTGDLQLAEDAVQDAAVAALEVWPRTGRAGRSRRRGSTWPPAARPSTCCGAEASRGDKEAAAPAWSTLLATDPPAPARSCGTTSCGCCSPAATRRSTSTPGWRWPCARCAACRPPRWPAALLVAEPTMAKRLVRAKQKIAAASIPYPHPGRGRAARPPGRRRAPWSTSSTPPATTRAGTELVRADLCDEAIRLARLLVELLPGDPTPEAPAGAAAADRRPAAGAARRATASWCRWPTRTGPAGTAADIAEGVALLDRSLVGDRRAGRPVPAAGGHRRLPRPGADLRGHRLAGDPAPVRAPRRPPPEPGRRAERRRRRRRGGRPRRRADRLDAIAERERDHLWHLARAELLVRDAAPRARPAPTSSERSPTPPAPPSGTTSAAASPPSPPPTPDPHRRVCCIGGLAEGRPRR